MVKWPKGGQASVQGSGTWVIEATGCHPAHSPASALGLSSRERPRLGATE